MFSAAKVLYTVSSILANCIVKTSPVVKYQSYESLENSLQLSKFAEKSLLFKHLNIWV